MQSHYQNYKAVCDQCGFTFRAHQLRKRWDGMMVCEKDWEPRHPQDFIKAVPDQLPLPYVRPDNLTYDVGAPINPATQTEKPPGTFTGNNDTI